MKRTALLVAIMVILSSCVVQKPKKVVKDPRHGREMWVAVAPLLGTADKGVNGAILSHEFEDGTYFSSVQLNVAPAPAGKQYVVWIRANPLATPVNLGILTSVTNDVRHMLLFQAKEDYRSDLDVLVTQQRAQEGLKKADIIAEGTLEPTP